MKYAPSPALVCAGAACGLLLGLAVCGDGGARAQVAAPPQPQGPSNRDQNAALQAVAKMTEGQRTYYQKNGRFRAR